MTRTLDELVETVLRLAKAQTVECPLAYLPHHGLAHATSPEMPRCEKGRVPDPAYAPLLALVREERNIICVDLTCFADGKYRGGLRKDHLHPELVTRTAYWEAAPNGALEGALIKALSPLASISGDPADNLVASLGHLLWRQDDTRLAALEAVEAWLKGEA